MTDKAPYGQYRADALAYARATRAEDRKFAALLWPRKVEAVASSRGWGVLGPAEIGCYRAAASAGYAAGDQLSYTNQDCEASAASTLPDTIRSMLKLPAR